MRADPTPAIGQYLASDAGDNRLRASPHRLCWLRLTSSAIGGRCVGCAVFLPWYWAPAVARFCGRSIAWGRRRRWSAKRLAAYWISALVAERASPISTLFCPRRLDPGGRARTSDPTVRKTNFGNLSGASAKVAVPEPSTMWLLLEGMLAVFTGRRTAVSSSQPGLLKQSNLQADDSRLSRVSQR
jgi:hypothetical protein